MMACNAVQTIGKSTSRIGEGKYAVPVIADRGDRAWVVTVCSDEPLRIGSRFQFGGVTWEIVRDRDLVRGFVAWPILRVV
jgi:hypothetical protein